jgi:hypothetical protein
VWFLNGVVAFITLSILGPGTYGFLNTYVTPTPLGAQGLRGLTFYWFLKFYVVKKFPTMICVDCLIKGGF